MIKYAPLLPWIRLALSNQSPVFSEGSSEGFSLLFPMERLFEEYVARVLSRDIISAYSLRPQMRSRYLVVHQGKPSFQLQPDLVVLDGTTPITVLDTKWKLIDGALTDSKYGLLQADFYQLFAYGDKYLNRQGDMFLIYPQHDGFTAPLTPFEFTDNLRLWVVPFDLRTDQILWPADCHLRFLRTTKAVAA
jgi:5-methylcytosine-specific restriction enzyme subunit McrC